ncbi:secretin and TonB N-terminal domain-containing protein [Pseudomonas sp. XS1P51]
MARSKRFADTTSQFPLPKSSVLALLIAVPCLGYGAAPQATSQPHAASAQRTYSFGIPAGSLTEGLMMFALQSGVQVSVESELLQGLSTGAVKGRLSLEQALARLLDDSDLTWQYSNDNAISIYKREAVDVLQLDSTRINSQAVEYQAERTIDRRTIESLPTGNGDITSLLRTNPSVQFDDSQLSGKTPGEISPANVSINGARYWQNLFVVDGMSMNNDIDPGSSTDSYDQVAGRSQGLALDTDLLEEIKVYDSNVPASYGGFNGGVIEANTRNPSRDLHGKVSAQMTRSSWTRYHVDKDDPALEEFEAGFGTGNQPEFDKLITRATLEGYLTDNFGLMGSFSRKDSTIPTRTFALSHNTVQANEEHEQTRRIDNYFLKSVWQINDDWGLDVSLTHAPETAHTYGSNALYSGRDTTAGGDSVSARLLWNAPLASVEQVLSWSQLENSRSSESDYLIAWRSSTTKNWSGSTTASEGGMGDIEQEQKSLGYKLKADWNSFRTYGLEHSLQTGLELSQSSTFYDRSTPYTSYSVAGMAQTSTCVGSDPLCSVGRTVNGWNGQYAKTKTVTQGKIGFDTQSWAVFLQDDMRWGRLKVRPGVRVDADDYMNKTTVAPRLAVELDVFGDGQTRLIGGANRYYGRNLSAYRLRDGVAALQSNYSRASQTSNWVYSGRVANGAKFNELEIPYDDELTLGLTHIQWNTEFALKYVNRKGRDQISRAWGSQIGQPSTNTKELASNYFTYYNGGESESDIYTLTITPLRDFSLWGTRTNGQLALDWTDVQNSGLSDYTTSIGLLYVDDPIIQYQGTFTNYSERPADNYNRPWTARLTTLTEIPRFNLNWSNFLRYSDGYRRIGPTGKMVAYNGQQVRVWEEVDYSGALTWNTRLAWELPTARDQALFVNLDVSNLLDKAIVSSTDSDNQATYEVGRQFMVEVGYRF